MKKNIIIATLFLGMSQSAHALFIDSGDFLTDSQSGLDWLDVTSSTNRSYNDVSAQFGSGGDYAGYRYATGDEFNTLVSNWTNATPPITSYDEVHQDEGTIDGLSISLGSTLDSSYLAFLGQTWDEHYGYIEGEGRDYTYGIIADTYFDTIQFVALIEDYDRDTGSQDYTQAYHGIIWRNDSSANVGSYLVRQSSISVPEPASLALMGLGLLGLGFSRRRKTENLSANTAYA